MTRVVRSLLLLLVALASTPALAASVQDVFGRPVPLGAGDPAIVFFANRGTRHMLRETAFPFVFDQRTHGPIVIVHIDLSDVPRPIKSLANGLVRSAWRESLDYMRALCRERGIEPPADLDARLFFITHRDGAPHREVGLTPGFHEAFAQVLSPDGAGLAGGPFPKCATDLARALDAAQ